MSLDANSIILIIVSVVIIFVIGFTKKMERFRPSLIKSNDFDRFKSFCY